MKKILIVLLLCISFKLSATTYYVSLSGNDTNPGTITQPWATWQYGWSHLHAGDVLYIRGGRYTDVYGGGTNKFGVLIDPTGRGIGYTGTSGSHISVSNYPGETPVLDCSACNSVIGQNIGIGLYNVSYWDITGIRIENDTQHQSVSAYDAQSWYLSNVYHITHNYCTAYRCGDGFSLHDSYDYIYYNYCDAIDNADTYPDPSGALPGSLANGFYCAPAPSSHIYYLGCRAINNSDDGWDTFGGSGYIEITNCWAINNGYCPAGGPIAKTRGDGSGFKMGPTTSYASGGSGDYVRILKNCVAIGNYGPGFDINKGSALNVKHALINCISAYNLKDAHLPDDPIEGRGFEYYGDTQAYIRNCVSFGNTAADELGSGGTKDHNSWNGHTANSLDYVSVDTSAMKVDRPSSGGLPLVTAFHLVSGSDLRGIGVAISSFGNVTALTTDCDGVTYANPPDLGPFEYSTGSGHTILTITGQSLLSTYTAAHSTLTDFTFTNNSISTSNTTGYILEAGDEGMAAGNNNLDAAVITGNKFLWTGTPGTPITHGVFVGYNKNDNIQYNYLNAVPYGMVIKSGESGTNMSYASGGVAYNIIKNSGIGIRIKGMNNVQIFNNTFYDNLSVGDYFIFITSNNDLGTGVASTGTKIKNNIFYSTTQLYNIYIETGSDPATSDVDYNLYYCEAGTPLFNYHGTSKTFAQWQSLGFDAHSVVVNPSFVNTTDFLPTSRLNYGTNLGTTWQNGLSTSASWVVNVTPSISVQNGSWQVGARVFTTGTSSPSVTTTAITSISTTSAVSGGNVTSDGGVSVTGRGICWNTLSNPTISNIHTTDGTGTGSFTSTATDLSPNTLYHVRAYATNSVGTSYGSDVQFTTHISSTNYMLFLNGKLVIFSGQIMTITQ